MHIMFDTLFTHIQSKVQLTTEDKTVLKTYFVPKKIRKKQYLLQQGEVCKFLSFVDLGILRSYHVDDKGNEHMNLFAWEGWWTSDMASYFSGSLSYFNIDAIEDSQVLMISLDDYDRMMEEVPVMERYFRMLFQKSLMTKERRLVSATAYTAEEKYLQLAEHNPEILKRIPQNLIASYIGLAPETLSRIRKNLLKNI